MALRAVFVALVLLGCSAAALPRNPTIAYQVKASYLYNFMRFISWPDDVFASGKFNLCVVGNDRFVDVIGMLTGESIEGRPIVVHRLNSITANGSRCHMLFVSAGEPGVPEPSIKQERGLLTVGESSGFIERGGIINLVEVQGRIRFQVNAPAAKQAGLVLSSRLLRLAMERQ